MSLPLRVTLLDGFEFTRGGERVEVAASQQRLVALLALQARPHPRAHAAALLWQESTEARAGANLRSVLWRLNVLHPLLVDSSGPLLALSPSVTIDARELAETAHRILDGSGKGGAEKLEFLGGELLPDWYDDWVLIERESLRQLRLHALEVLVERFIAAGQLASALETGLSAVRTDPLRESAHRLVIRTYLAEGNAAAAFRQFALYGRIVREKLGLGPSPQMLDLFAPSIHLPVTHAVTPTVTVPTWPGRTVKSRPDGAIAGRGRKARTGVDRGVRSASG